MQTDTNERLRKHLNGNHPAQERLCVSVLRLDPLFTEVRGRLPEGGRDGGIDITARYMDQYDASGAVGFLNDAFDSNKDHNRRIKAKFKDDLGKALKRNPLLGAFVFFTNLDLRPAEETDLVRHAREQGAMSYPDRKRPLFVSIYDRERLTIVLDRPEAMAIRLHFLDIEMKKEELVSILATTNKILISEQQLLRRIEFQQGLKMPIDRIVVTLYLAKPVSAKELGDFRILVGLVEWQAREPDSTGIWLAMANTYLRMPRTANSPARNIPRASCVLTSEDHDWLYAEEEQSLSSTPQNEFTFGVHFLGDPELLLEHLNGRGVHVYAQGNIATLVEGISIEVGRYELVRARGSEIFIDNVPSSLIPPIKWPRGPKTNEKDAPWTDFNMSSSILNFTLVTPRLVLWE